MKRISVNDPVLFSAVILALANGGLIVYPTETSYGLGVDATNAQAIEKLLAYKGNRLNKALSVAVADKEMAQEYIEMNPTALHIFEKLLPGPITVVARSQGKVAGKVESPLHTLGVRWSSLPLVSEIVSRFGRPITATSANTSGSKQLFSIEEFERYVAIDRQNMVDIFVDAGVLPVKPPSTIVDTTLESLEILRQGELVFSEGATNFVSDSTEQTIELGKQLIEQQMDLIAAQPLVIALEGNLGAGKTHFIKGVAQALGIVNTVNSPTYTIMKEYPFKTTKMEGVLYHIDTWRLFEGEGIGDLGMEHRIQAGSVIAIEWQQKAREWIDKLKRPVLFASVKIDELSENQRKVTVLWEQKK